MPFAPPIVVDVGLVRTQSDRDHSGPHLVVLAVLTHSGTAHLGAHFMTCDSASKTQAF